MDVNFIDPDTEFQLYLCYLSDNVAEFTIEQFIAALESTTTLTELTVNFDEYEPTPENIQRVIEPLCRCISNLRLHNAQHPLCKLSLLNPFDFEGVGIDENEMLDALEKFLVAAKQFGIFHMDFICVNYLPVQFLVEFCRDNNSLKVLELHHVFFSSGAAALPLPLNDGLPNNSFILTLDKLKLGNVSFENSTEATVFANLVAHVNVSSLEVDILFRASNNDDEEEEDNDDEITQITERILSELKMPSVEQLTLCTNCQTGNFKAALNAGRTTVTDLDVVIYCGNDDKTAKLKLLASFIRRAVKLSTLRITFLDSNRPRISLPPLLFQAMEACATVMQIQVIRYKHQHDIVPDVCPAVQQLQKIASRNLELDSFATNPGTFPTEELPELMRQFDHCPTGRYMLARRLPEVLSFAELYAMHLLRRRTNPPTATESKLQ